MSENNENIKLHRCIICNKNYSSQSSLCNHNKKFHIINTNLNYNQNNLNNNPINNPTNLNIINTDVNDHKKYNCNKCNKEFGKYQHRWRHEKICKNNKFNLEINNKAEIIEIKNMLKEIIEKNCKIHHKKLDKINKQLINNTTNNISNTNNGTIINNTYVKFGNEQLSSLLSKNDMLKIINKQCLCIEESIIKKIKDFLIINEDKIKIIDFYFSESIKSVHFNKNLPEYNNIFITNMKDTIAYIFDGSKFILTSKDEVINDLYNSHLENIEQFLEEAKIPENKYSKITKFLDTLNDNEKCFIDGASNNKKYNNYKAYKLVAIKNLIYNASDHKLLKKLNNIELKEKISDEIKLE
jgi:hypothetical protein